MRWAASQLAPAALELYKAACSTPMAEVLVIINACVETATTHADVSGVDAADPSMADKVRFQVYLAAQRALKYDTIKVGGKAPRIPLPFFVEAAVKAMYPGKASASVPVVFRGFRAPSGADGHDADVAAEPGVLAAAAVAATSTDTAPDDVSGAAVTTEPHDTAACGSKRRTPEAVTAAGGAGVGARVVRQRTMLLEADDTEAASK